MFLQLLVGTNFYLVNRQPSKALKLNHQLSKFEKVNRQPSKLPPYLNPYISFKMLLLSSKRVVNANQPKKPMISQEFWPRSAYLCYTF